MTNITSPLPQLFFTRQTPHGKENVKTLSQSTLTIARAAQELGVSFVEIPESRVVALEYQGTTQYLHTLIPSTTSELASHLCDDKVATKAFLTKAGISMAKGYHLVTSDQPAYWDEVFNALTKPLVVKPTTGQQGKSIFMGVDTLEKYHAAIEACFKYEGNDNTKARILVEETFVGTEYRVLATRDKVVGIINRQPANVVGDGHSTIQQLIDQKNADPRRSDDPNDALIKIKVDSHVQEHLASQNLTTESVPAADQKIYLRRNSNISTGGDSIDFTDLAHPSVHELCIKVMQALPGLNIAGIDLMTKDITAPQTPDSYIIIEVNSSPGIIIHEMPYSGEPRPAAKEFIYLLFPQLRPQS
jgi:cyanophycin synthetase